MQEEDRLMDAEETAELLGITVAGLRQRLARKSAAPRPIRLGRSNRWRRADVLAWIGLLAEENGANYSSRPQKEEPARRKRGRPRKELAG